MKKTLQKILPNCLLVWCICIITNQNATAQSWQAAGKVGFSDSTAQYTTLALDANGTPFIAYKDASHNNKATVMKYIGGTWVPVGNPGFTADSIGYEISMAIDANGTPYVAYQDWGKLEAATVMKYNGSSWVLVGTAGFSYSDVGFMSIAIDKKGTPYVAYSDDRGFNTDRATVKKYDGSNWVDVGTPAFSAGAANYTSIAIDNTGTPWIAYSDYGNGGKVSVLKYDGSNWVTIGALGFSPFLSAGTTLVFDSHNTPYVAYSDQGGDFSYKATVMKYDGRSSWAVVGNESFSAGYANYISLAIDSSDVPYVAYSDESTANSSKATVMKYDGSNWMAVGSAGFSPDTVANTAMVIKKDGQIFVAYQDQSESNKATVMTYKKADTTVGDTSTTPPSVVQSVLNNKLKVNVFPNPATDYIIISYDLRHIAPTTLRITNIAGQVIITKDLGKSTSGAITVSTTQLPAGVYILQVTSGSETIKQKIVKQ